MLRSKAVQYIVFKGYMDDEKYIRKLFIKELGYIPNLDDPKTFNEKNNWRKINDRRDLYTDLVDKYKIKKIIAKKVGSEYAFPLIGRWKSPKEIDFDSLPEQFVLKTNHSEGGIICKDKSKINRKRAIRELTYQFGMNYYIQSREWPYKNVDRCIIAEKYMGEDLIDYKNYCFNGHVTHTYVWKDVSKADGSKPEAFFCGAYDRNWEKTEVAIEYPTKDILIKKPSCHEKMIELAEIMSKNIPFVRVDCYIIENRVYIGEMTFFPWGGFQKFSDNKWDDLFGDLEVLPNADS